jgi:regulatory protein
VTLDGSIALEHALGLAYAYLNRRERTRHELREHLLARDVQPEVAEQALAELARNGYVDDRRFARLFAEDRSELDQWGSERIRRALVNRGISADVADEVLAESAGSDELDRAVVLLERRFPGGLVNRREAERALGVLVRRGFEYDLATDALNEHRRRAGAASGSQRL